MQTLRNVYRLECHNPEGEPHLVTLAVNRDHPEPHKEALGAAETVLQERNISYAEIDVAKQGETTYDEGEPIAGHHGSRLLSVEERGNT